MSLRPISKRRARDLRKRAKVVARVHERDGGCVASGLVPEVRCWTPEGHRDGHELVKHGQWKAGWLEEDNVVSVCRAHHDWIEEQPAKAFELGLAKHAEPGPVRKYEWEPRAS